MKKTLCKLLAVALIVCTMLGALAGCGSTLKGTYRATESGGSLTFDKEQKVTGELFGITLDGTYEIKDDQITFSYTGIAGIGATVTKSFEKNGDTLIIDGTEFVKEK